MTGRAALSLTGEAPALHRLRALAPLDLAAIEIIEHEASRSRLIHRGRNLMNEGRAIVRPALILEGWAARVRLFEDGRLQILSFLLPGDLIGHCHHAYPVAASTVTALSDVRYCAAPPASLSARLAQAYAVSQAYEEAYLLAQIARLGRLTALERLGDLLLELLERLELCGLAHQGRFELPLTQQILADATGLTVVHVNRMVRELRQHGDITWSGGSLVMHDPPGFARKLGRMATRVQESGART